MFSNITNCFITSFKNFYKYKRKICHGLRRYQSSTSTSSCTKRESRRILFFGTDNFSLPSLMALRENNDAVSSLGVVTSFKSPANCVRTYAAKENLPLLRWPIKPEHCRDYDLGIVVSFGHLIPSDVIKAFPFGMINVHASLLPKWRGAAPIIYAIMNGDTRTGVSIMKIEPHRFDIGDILAQREVELKSDILMPELHSQLANEGSKLLVETVKNFSYNLEHAFKQNEAEATFAPKITSDITEVSWCTMNAQHLYRRYRALYGFKSLVTSYLDKQVQLLKIGLPTSLPKRAPKEPGAFIFNYENKSLLLCCAEQTYIEVLQLRLEGKKAMTASEFNNGFLKQPKNVVLSFKQNRNIAC